MKTNGPFQFKTPRSITSSAFESDYFTEPWMYGEAFLNPNVNHIEVGQIGIPPVYALGYILVCLTMFFVCNLLYHTIRNTPNKVRRRNHAECRITLGNPPIAPIRLPPVSVLQDTTPKSQIRPSLYSLFPRRTHSSYPPLASSFRRSSPESVETFEPLESYRFVHPDIPNEIIGPMRSSTPESDYVPLHDRTIEPISFGGNMTRTDSFRDSIRWMASESNRSSPERDSASTN